MEKRRIGGGTWEMACVILTLAWPTMLEQLMQTAVQYQDGLQVRLAACAGAEGSD